MRFKIADVDFFKEIFLLFETDYTVFDASADEEEPLETDFLLRNSFEEIQDTLSLIFVDDSTFSQPAIIHGIVTPATVLPNIEDSRFINTWVVCISREFVSERFKTILNGEMRLVNKENIVETIEEAFKIYDEEEVFILYGNDVNVTFALDEEELNDKSMDECSKICSIAEKLATEG